MWRRELSLLLLHHFVRRSKWKCTLPWLSTYCLAFVSEQHLLSFAFVYSGEVYYEDVVLSLQFHIKMKIRIQHAFYCHLVCDFDLFISLICIYTYIRFQCRHWCPNVCTCVGETEQKECHRKWRLGTLGKYQVREISKTRETNKVNDIL